MLKAIFIVPFLLAAFASTPAFAKRVTNPETSSMEGTLIRGLKLLKDGKFDEWIDKLCSKEHRCFHENAKRDLKRFNLPAKQRRAPNCLKDGGNAIEIDRVEDIGKDRKKVFLKCEETAMPLPFFLIEENGKWMFSEI